MHEQRQARAVAIEEEHEDQAQGQLQDAPAHLGATGQQPVAHLPQVRLDRHHQCRALFVDAVPPTHQALAHQRQAAQPCRGLGQAIHLDILDERRGITHVIRQVEAEPDQWSRYQQHPAQGQQTGGQGFAAVEPASQQTHQRPAGKSQDRPQNRADQKGAITQKLAPNSTRSRICTNRRSLLGMKCLAQE